MSVAPPTDAIQQANNYFNQPAPAICAPITSKRAEADAQAIQLERYSFNFSGGRSIVTLPIKGHTMEKFEIAINEPLLSKKLPIQLVRQEGNTCGPTALYMVLRALSRVCTLDEVSQDSYCSELIGTSPVHIKSTAAKYGLYSSLCNNTSDHMITELIDEGGFPIALIQKAGELHYVVIHGYDIERGQKLVLHISDPNGVEYSQSMDDFSESWVDVHLRGINIGASRLMIAINDKETPEDTFDDKIAFLANVHATLNEIPTFFETLKNLIVRCLETVSLILDQPRDQATITVKKCEKID